VIGNPSCVWATAPRMRIGMNLIRRGAKCLGICSDRLFPSPDGLQIGSGAMTMMMAYAANVEPIFFGKPQKSFFEKVCSRLGAAPEQCILIGDNLESDIAGARDVGMATVLSLTGVAQAADLENAQPNQKPNWIVEDLTQL
jgi:glycerol-1-phosphatase